MEIKHKIDISNDIKAIVKSYVDLQNRKQKCMEILYDEDVDRDEFVFRICTSSGTRINVPTRILKGILAVFGTVAIGKTAAEVLTSVATLKNSK